jgi:hypothetical protein
MAKFEVLSNPEQHKVVIGELKAFVEVDNDKVSAYLPDWLAIYDLLSTPGLFRDYMYKLEKEVVEFNKTIPDHTRPRDRLISFFKQWAKLHGFSDLIILNRLLNINEFHAEILRNENLFVDSYTGFYDHGEWPHVLQWYVVAKHLQKNPSYLQHDLPSIYASFADAEVIHGETDRSAWNFFFDSYYDNFTNPKYVTSEMKDYQSQYIWPELCSSIADNGASLRFHL